MSNKRHDGKRLVLNDKAVRHALAERGMSWRMLGELSGVKSDTLRRWAAYHIDLSDKPAETIGRIGDTLGLRWEELVVHDEG